MTTSDRAYAYTKSIKAANRAREDARKVIASRDKRIIQVIKSK